MLISIHALREEGDKRFSSTSSSLWNFYPRPPRGGRQWKKDNLPTRQEFLSTPSARRATYASRRHRQHRANFYPRPPRGGRRHLPLGRERKRGFLSTPSARRATESGTSLDKASPISIHALREEGDLRFAVTAKRQKDFYPRPPRGGRRQRGGKCGQKVTFLSTPSARRATTASQLPQNCQDISIHALREEGDAQLSGNNREGMQFLSTPSARRATALLVGCKASASNFYPRPPRGGRHTASAMSQQRRRFLSTPSARRATAPVAAAAAAHNHFYPRPPRGGRPRRLESARTCTDFYPRPPRGGRPDCCNAGMHACEFLSTPSARRATPSSDTLYRSG